jgi:transketolase
MRLEFARTIVELASQREDLIFLSGDLGYMALEEVRSALGDRFINAGVAEQNMVSTAAGLAAQGFTPLVYSIAPFATLRPFEQIRNDVCLHNLPVKIIGNGGGYGYGIMGSTHHALEDVGVMRSLPHMRVFVPSFGGDVAQCVHAALDSGGPCYIRLGKSAEEFGHINAETPWASFRRVTSGSKIVIAVMGPVVENVISVVKKLGPEVAEVWAVGEFPLVDVPQEFKNSAQRAGRLVTVEEHYQSGGLCESLAPHVVGIPGLRLESMFASGYPSGLYGSQKWHQDDNGMGEEGIRNLIHRAIAA